MTNKVIDIIENIQKVIVGKHDIIELVMTAMLSGGHVLLEDTPGTGKTMLAKALARSVNMDFKRIQFTPDLLPSDVTGINYYNQKQGEFVLRKGPAFCNILLADEINRATPRTQSSLLECMEEKQITIDGETIELNNPFFVIATQNPVETAGTYQLPEAQMDRFLMQLSMGYPSFDEEAEILQRFLTEQPLEQLQTVCSREELLAMSGECRRVYLHPLLAQSIVDICQKTRRCREALAGVSPRAALALSVAVRALAFIRGRDYVTPEDIKNLSIPVLAHRIVLPRGMQSRENRIDIINKCWEQIEIPTEDWSR